MSHLSNATRDFSFPGQPYTVQTALMSAIYDCIENRQIGLLESPTGTGKTLSIICSSLTWLAENRHTNTGEVEKDEDELDWVLEQTQNRKERLANDEVMRRKNAYWQRMKNASVSKNASEHTGSTGRKRRVRRCRSREPQSPTDSFLSSDDEDDQKTDIISRSDRSVKSARIIFATRTHSQLTQFLEELRKTRFKPPPVDSIAGSFQAGFREERVLKAQHHLELPLSVISFGSRKQFCINEDVRALESSAAISERCRELTEAPEETATATKRKRSRNRCVYKNSEAEGTLRDKALVEMHSIEELGEVGKQIGACPYFATRSALESGDVDVIGVPYSAILHAPTRESLGLDVDENTVVIFDEAHNIVDTVCDLHSSTLTRPALVQTKAALQAYIRRYESRFSSTNLFSLRQLLALCEGLLSLLPDRNDEMNRYRLAKPKVVHPSSMLLDARADNINLLVLVTFMRESKLSKKLRGFVDSGEYISSDLNQKTGSKLAYDSMQEKKLKEQRRSKQSMAAFENFVNSISDCPHYGRVALYPYRRNAAGLNGKKLEDEDCIGLDATARLKYFVTEPGELFAANVGRARAILMLGGTLSPRSAIKAGLLDGLHQGVTELECEHVVPAHHVLARVCGIGPKGNPLEFTYQRRQNPENADELGHAIDSLSRTVPGGVVIFFSSYELLRTTLERWTATGILKRIEETKPCFAETRGDNRAFEAYRQTVEEDERRGAILTAVMGGKLSEGINFSDALGRVVVMVGMPFANAAHAETAEVLKRFKTPAERSEFLENQCMTVVNQCIGRAVRHKSDYAAILLMDRRYARMRVVQKLPRFVRNGFAQPEDFDGAVGELRNFFERMRRPNACR